MIRGIATGVVGYLTGFAATFALCAACGGRVPCPTKATDADRAPRVAACEVRR